MQSSAIIYIDRSWLAKNMDKFIKAFDDTQKEQEKKGTHIMIKLDLPDTESFAISNEVLSMSLFAVDEKDPKKTLAYLAVSHDMTPPEVQNKMAQWMINRFAKLQAAANILLRTDQTEG